MQDNQELLENLRALAVVGSQGAPDRVERQLRTEFRKRRWRRRIKVWTSISGVAAIAAGIALLLWVHHAPKSAAQPSAAEMFVSGHVAAGSVPGEEEADASFYPLPQAEDLPALEDAMVVRVQLPVSSLRLMGFPVDEERADEVQAELLLGQDGLARGVRLVQ
jgi:hypothetical protein